MSTVGVMWFAYCIPSISCLPPAPESPVAGSNTPIRTTLSPEAASPLWLLSLSELLELPPQAVMPKAMDRASSIAKNFFIQFILLYHIDRGLFRDTRTNVFAFRYSVFYASPFLCARSNPHKIFSAFPRCLLPFCLHYKHICFSCKDKRTHLCNTVLVLSSQRRHLCSLF